MRTGTSPTAYGVARYPQPLRLSMDPPQASLRSAAEPRIYSCLPITDENGPETARLPFAAALS